MLKKITSKNGSGSVVKRMKPGQSGQDAMQSLPQLKTKAPAPEKINKTAFVLSFPTDMPAGEIVAAAQEKGFDISVAYVYSIRTAAKAKSKRAAPSSQGALFSEGANPKPVARVNRPIVDSVQQAEALLLAISAELGLSRALEVLQAQRSRVAALLGGGA